MTTSLVSRVVLTLPAVILTVGLLGDRGDSLLVLSAGVVLFDGSLLVVSIRKPALLVRRWLLLSDLAVTVASMVVATLLVSSDTFLLPGRDAMTGYGWGTVALWTAIRGWRTGAFLVLGTAIAQLAMTTLNGADLDAAGMASIFQRTWIAFLNFLVAAAIVAVAHRGARLIVSEGLRAGGLAERAETLRSMHDTALAELDAVVLLARRESRTVEERLNIIRRRAVEQSALLGASVSEAVPAAPLMQRLAVLVEEFRARELQVDVVVHEPVGAVTHSSDAVDALVGGVREALNNVVKHAGVRASVVHVREASEHLEVDVVDRGRGFVGEGKGAAGFGLASSISARIRDVGGHAQVTTQLGGGTRVRLIVPTHGERRSSSPETVTAAGAARWFPLVPLLGRLVSLPIIASKVGTALPSGTYALLGGLLVGHIALIGALLRPAGERVLRSRVLFCVDLAVAAGIYLWAAAAETAGIVLTPEGEGTWLYIICTVPFWLAARGPRVGAAVLLGALVLEAAVIVIDVAPAGPVPWAMVVVHVVQVGATTAYAGLVVLMAKRGFLLARVESLRSGRQAERVQVLDRLRQGVLETWRAIAEIPEALPVDQRLEAACSAARATAGELRAALRADRSAAGDLAGELEALVKEFRRSGLSVQLVATELSGDPPPAAVAALVAATRISLHGPSEPGRSVVVRVSGSTVRSEVCVRDTAGCVPAGGGAAERMALVGGRVDVRPNSGGGTRTRLTWSAP